MILLGKYNVRLLTWALVISAAMLTGCAHHNHHGGKHRTKHLSVNHVAVPIAAPKARVNVRGVRPHKNSIWVDGYWGWDGNKYVWLDGYWRSHSTGKTWVAGRWKHHSRGWVWVNGRWG